MKKAGTSSRNEQLVFAVIFIFCILISSGCGPSLSSPEEIRRFSEADPRKSETEIDNLSNIRSRPGPYRVMCGDILELKMPVVLRVISSDLSEWLKPVLGHKDIESYFTRVDETGNITLPIVGKLNVVGKTLAEIESQVIGAYHPKYVVNPPMVVCRMSKYKNENERIFAVLGLVQNSDAFSYPPDVQYNLLEALAFAGGLDMVADPRYLKVYRQDADGEIVSAVFSIDSKSLIDASRVIIKPGDIIYVDHTLRTRTNRFLSDVLQLRAGFDVSRNNSD